MFAGNSGYKYLVMGEEGIQTFVSYAKTTIVIRSLVVMRDNIMGNNLHLMSWGIGPIQMAKGYRDKFLETNQYLKNQERILELNAELAANIDDPRKSRRINAELEVLADANSKLSIKPLLDAGEFSTVSESLTEADLSIRDGKFGDFLEWATDRLPEPVQGLGKNFLITKDTALFQGLNRAVQYGDFVAKAVLYDHLMKEKGYSQKEALDVISEEFVNYNRLAGRDRDYLESTGLMWFWNYKIRIMKIVARMAREKPASLVLWTGGVAPMLDVDSVASGSLVGAWNKGTLDYAIGPEMGIGSLTMNPWMSLGRLSRKRTF